MFSTTVVVFEITGVLFFVITVVMSLKLAMIVLMMTVLIVVTRKVNMNLFESVEVEVKLVKKALMYVQEATDCQGLMIHCHHLQVLCLQLIH